MAGEALLSIRRRVWRILTPKWASQPLSGDGAALRGGRWNPVGQPALYFSESHGTAIAEYNQDLVRPGTLAAYDLASDSIADLCAPRTRAELGVPDAVLRAPWKDMLDAGHEPPGWALAQRLMRKGVDGIRVPSAQVSGTNIVIWRWNAGTGTTVSVVDPLGDLPRDQSSW